MSIQSINPYNGELLETHEEMTPQEIDVAIAKAHEAYKEWRTKPIAERAKVLKRVAELYRERKDELALLMAK